MKLLISSLFAFTLTSTALADDEPGPRLLCLESLDVRQTQPIVSEVAPRARVHADQQTNCFVIVAHDDRYAQITRIIARLEERAQRRSEAQRGRLARRP